MKIGPSYDKSLLDAGGLKTDKKPAARVDTPATGSTGSPGAQVQISNLSSRLAQIEKELSTSDAFDTKKVESVKQAISEGRFKVNSDQVADKLIASVRDLLGSTK